ncbi:MAG: radical SAM/Cys-rich domain protein [Nevskiaceae bacterium]|nr:MAG: radical SAM/Cys-rich domain protein [Nevskiaceae bacterium]TAM27419.1 MAG: radical SAM/Cys-rich domain protein [Nevskiaceae bacterium]
MDDTPIPLAQLAGHSPDHDFQSLLNARGLRLPPLSIETLQVNLTKLCNQACRHCHVDSSPSRTEALPPEGVAAVLGLLARHPQISKLDLTGGAPELHPQFDELVRAAVRLGKQVMVRHNLTVQLDGHPQTGESKAHLPAFFAEQGVEVISSLPYWQEFFTDSQRGKGVFGKSLTAMQRLNAVGYGIEGSGLLLNLVYNPVGPYLPAAQAGLEADYKRELREKFGLHFNRLYTITNMPIHRFALHLRKSGQYQSYMDKLLSAFNPAAAEGVMCRSLISVDHQGRLYDCDFNQQLGLAVETGSSSSLADFDFEALMARRIRWGSHCLGCTAGAGSSCGGATAA